MSRLLAAFFIGVSLTLLGFAAAVAGLLGKRVW